MCSVSLYHHRLAIRLTQHFASLLQQFKFTSRLYNNNVRGLGLLLSRKCAIPVVSVKLGKLYVVKHNCVT